MPGEKGLKNPLKLTAQQLSLLREELGLLGRQGAGVAESALRYVVDGEEEEVLALLAGKAGAAAGLGLYCTTQRVWGWKPTPRRRELLAKARVEQAACWLRLGRVWEAASARHRPGLLSATVPGFPAWLEILLEEMVKKARVEPGQVRRGELLSAECVEAMLELAGEPPDTAVRAMLVFDPGNYEQVTLATLLEAVGGLREALRRHRQTVSEVIEQAPAACRAQAFELLLTEKVPLEEFAESLVRAALAPGKAVRQAARPLLTRLSAALPQVLRTLCESKRPQDRAGAAQLLWETEGEQALPYLRERRQAESAAKVIEALDGILALAAPATEAEPTVASALPPVTVPETPEPVTPALREAVEQFGREIGEELRSRAGRGARGKSGPPVEFAEQLVKALQAPRPKEPAAGSACDLLQGPYASPGRVAIRALLRHRDLKLGHAVRLLLATRLCLSPWDPYDGSPTAGGPAILNPDFCRLLAYHWQAQGSTPGLRELAAHLAAAGGDPEALGRLALGREGEEILSWGAEAVWPYFAERPHLLEEALGLRPAARRVSDWEARASRDRALELLAGASALPPQLDAPLWPLALRGTRQERRQLREAFRSYPGRETRLIHSLGSSNKDERATAAEWLSELGCAEAVEPLRAALRKEKQEPVRAAMMLALERLGASLDEFLDRDELAAQAAKDLAAGTPAALDWFPFSRLPAVTWADNGQPVKPEVVTWLLVSSFKLKDPAPGPLLRRYCALFTPAEREALGLFVLQSWIAEDTRPAFTREEAEQEAMTGAQTMLSLYQPQDPELTEERLAQAILRNLLQQVEGTAIGEKGLLAVAAACGSRRMVPLIERYLKDWYGQRAAQSKALLQVLPWIDDPRAIQLLLSVAGRFRTRSIQQEAEMQVQELAERSGWTRTELEDRTVPCAGLDASGVLELDCGSRTYTARLDDDLRLVLANDSGREVKDLPAAAGPEAEALKAARKTLSETKKGLKELLQLQQARLLESMCAQRLWRFADWQQFLQQHPVVGRLCQRLVWCVSEGGQCRGTFRPLADGTLTDCEEESVTLPPEALVGVAHAALLGADEAARWALHLADYKVTPLFTQFPAEVFVLPAERGAEDELRDFRGYLLEAGRLLGEAGKRDWVRGPVEEGGWFVTYRKDFPSLGLQALLEFSGSALDDRDRLVALLSLSFTKLPSSSHAAFYQAAVPLAEVPPVLVSECYRQWREIAESGLGFDPEWESKVEV